MAVDKNALEQRALTFLSRGQVDRAVSAYIAILKADPRDRRIRQKLAEAYLKVGRGADAERQFRQLARAYAHDGNHRAAISVLKRLMELLPKDLELVGQLAEAHFAAGNRSDALPLYRKAWDITWRVDIIKAIPFGEQVLVLTPGDQQFLVDMAESCLSVNMRDKAYELYMRAIRDLRRRGQSEDVGRMALRALAIRPDDPSLLKAAAEAALDVGDHDMALSHLVPALERSPEDADILELVARCYESQGDAQLAPTLVRLAQACESQGLAERWLAAVQQAQALGVSGLDRDLARASGAAERARFRLWNLPEAEPQTEGSLRICVRAEVMTRYGFRGRALDELRDALVRDRSAAVLAWATEIFIAEGETEDGLQWASELLEALGGDSARSAARRIHALGGPDPGFDEAPPEQAAHAPVEDADDELIDDELIDDDDTAPQAEADPAASSPEPDEELNPFGSGSDPFDDVFREGGTFAEVDPDEMPPLDELALDDPFAEAAAPEPDPPVAAEGSGTVEEAASMIGMGLFSQAARALRDVDGLRAAALRSICQRELATPHEAFDELRDHIDDADEADEGYPEALFELAELGARAGKQKLALRTLRDLEEGHPDFRRNEVRTRIKLLKRLLG